MTLSKEIRDCPNQGHRLNALYEKGARNVNFTLE